MPSIAHSRVPSLGLVLYLLKNSAADFFQFHQSHRQSLGKLQSLEQLPPEELKEVSNQPAYRLTSDHWVSNQIRVRNRKCNVSLFSARTLSTYLYSII